MNLQFLGLQGFRHPWYFDVLYNVDDLQFSDQINHQWKFWSKNMGTLNFA